jgi:hypothetical protein
MTRKIDFKRSNKDYGSHPGGNGLQISHGMLFADERLCANSARSGKPTKRCSDCA